MVFVRVALAVVVGYLIFAVASMLLVGPVMTSSGPLLMVAALLGLALIGLASGLINSAIAGGRAKISSMILAGLVAAATLANLAIGLGAEPNWYKIGTLFLTVPVILLIGLRRSASTSA